MTSKDIFIRTYCRNQPQPKPSSDVILEEGDDKLVHLIRELLLNKMASFRYVLDLQIRNKVLQCSTPHIILHSWKLKCIVFFSHDQQHRNLNFRIGLFPYTMSYRKQSGIVSTILKDFIHMLTLAVHLYGIWRGK